MVFSFTRSRVRLLCYQPAIDCGRQRVALKISSAFTGISLALLQFDFINNLRTNVSQTWRRMEGRGCCGRWINGELNMQFTRQIPVLSVDRRIEYATLFTLSSIHYLFRYDADGSRCSVRVWGTNEQKLKRNTCSRERFQHVFLLLRSGDCICSLRSYFAYESEFFRKRSRTYWTTLIKSILDRIAGVAEPKRIENF